MLYVFKYFHASVERETRRQLKYIRTDNDTEYRSLFEKYYRDHDIMLEKIIPKIF